MNLPHPHALTPPEPRPWYSCRFVRSCVHHGPDEFGRDCDSGTQISSSKTAGRDFTRGRPATPAPLRYGTLVGSFRRGNFPADRVVNWGGAARACHPWAARRRGEKPEKNRVRTVLSVGKRWDESEMGPPILLFPNGNARRCDPCDAAQPVRPCSRISRTSSSRMALFKMPRQSATIANTVLSRPPPHNL